MPTDLPPDPIPAYVAGQVKSGAWGPFEMLDWAADRDAVDRFRLCVMFVRLCQDDEARADPLHGLFHAGYGVQGCPAGWDLVLATQKSLGFSDERAAYLIEQMDQETRAIEAAVGSE